MFRVIYNIDDNVFQFACGDNGTAYISNIIGKKEFKLTSIFNETIYKYIPDSSIYNPLINEDKVSVSHSGTKGFTFQRDLKAKEEMPFMIKEINEPWSLVRMSGKETSNMGFVDNETKEIKWRLSYSSNVYYVGKEFFYVRKQIDEKNNHIYAYDLKTGKEKWLYVIDRDEKYGYVKFCTEYDGKLYFHADYLYILDIQTGKVLEKRKAFGGMVHYESEVPYILNFIQRAYESFFDSTNKVSEMRKDQKWVTYEGEGLPILNNFFYKQNLITQEIEVVHLNTLLEPFWDRFKQVTYIECQIEGMILVGTHKYLTEKEIEEERVFNLLLIDPIKNKVVWDHQFPNYGLSNYKEARYEYGKLFFLDKAGCLTIFEKET